MHELRDDDCYHILQKNFVAIVLRIDEYHPPFLTPKYYTIAIPSLGRRMKYIYGNKTELNENYLLYCAHTKYFPLPSGETVVVTDVSAFRVTTVNAPDEDMETLMVDPITGTIYILTKNHDGPEANIYRYTIEYSYIAI